MEEKIINMNQFLGAAQGDQEHMLGKFLYFSLANLLVDKDELSSLCESMGIPYTGSTRLSLGDAFRSATGDIRERVPVTVDGETNIYLAYCRDNKRTAGVFSRELVKETLNRETNRYEKLANISCGKNDGMFRCDNLVLDDAVDVQGCCRKAEELFELYQRCANRKQIETICVNFLRGMEATKLSVTGHMYFVPRTFMERVDIFEDFITLLSGLNKKQTPLVVNSFYIIDDAKQRDKMTEEFYLAVKKEIAAYQEKCDYRRIHVHDRGIPAAFASQIQLAAVLPAATQPGHLPAAGAAEVWSQPRNGRLLSVGLLPGILFRRLFLRRLENIRFHQYGVSLLTGVTGIFQKALYLMLVPERHFPAIRNTLPVQGVRDGLIGSPGVVERKDHTDGPLLLRHDLQRAVSDLIPV